LDVIFDVAAEFVGDALHFDALDEGFAVKVDLGAFVGGFVAVFVADAFEFFEAFGWGEFGEFVPLVNGAFGGGAAGPVDEFRFGDAVADDGGDAGDAFVVAVDVVVVGAAEGGAFFALDGGNVLHAAPWGGGVRWSVRARR